MTNDDKPFEPGELIEFCGDRFEVVENFGNGGTVKEPGDSGTVQFYWTFQGEKCKRVNTEK